MEMWRGQTPGGKKWKAQAEALGLDVHLLKGPRASQQPAALSHSHRYAEPGVGQ